jgi:hypothetical protein
MALCGIAGGTPAAIASRVGAQVGSSVQSYDVADIRSLRFDSEAEGASPSSKQPTAPSTMEKDEVANASSTVTIPAGTRLSVRTIDSIDSTENHVGYRFQASLEEPLSVDGNKVVPKAGWMSPKRPELSLEGPN